MTNSNEETDKRLVYEVPEAGAMLGLTRNASYEASEAWGYPNHQNREAHPGSKDGVSPDARARRCEMSAAIMPFPITRRHGFVAKQIAHAACMNPGSAVKYIEHQLLIQRDAMRRRGIAEDLIARELRCLAAALHTEFLQVTSAMGDR